MTALQLAAHWSCQIFRLPASAQEAPMGGEINPVFPYQEVCLVNFLPLAPQNLQGIDNPFNEAHQAVCRLSP